MIASKAQRIFAILSYTHLSTIYCQHLTRYCTYVYDLTLEFKCSKYLFIYLFIHSFI